jgi:hypothetical protein
VHDFLLDEALKRLAMEAATRFSAMVASGDQIPFDVAEQDGPDSLFYRYEPLTARFVRERQEELRSLPAFVPARDAVEEAGVAVPYLEARGEAVPAESRERAAHMLTVFIASLWDGCTEFALDRARLDSALAVLDAEACDPDDADVLIAPLVGLRMPMSRLQLPHNVSLVRADAIEAPIEAMRSEGMERRAWEPQYLAVVEQDESPDSADAAMRQLRELISVMRLFKRGGIGLGPYAFAPTGEGQWRRIATGAPATRPGGYELNEDETAALVEFAEALEARPDPGAALTWAVGRFEMGCARPNALEGLSDSFLALRAVLEGQGPVGASLSMRAAALCDDGSMSREEAGQKLERALDLERSLMSGARIEGALELATWLEGCARSILCQAARGELGSDLGAAAEETLIAAGLDAGDGTIVDAATEWETPDTAWEEPDQATWEAFGSGKAPSGAKESVDAAPRGPRKVWEEPPTEQLSRPAAWELPDTDWEASEKEWEIPEIGEVEVTVARAHDQEEAHDMEHNTRILEPIPEENEIRITATNWLDEVSVGDSTLEWPAIEGDIERRQRSDTPRDRHLFPVPEDADWDVGELNYDHYRRRAS